MILGAASHHNSVSLTAVGAVIAGVGGVIAAIATIVRLIWEWKDRRRAAQEHAQRIQRTRSFIERRRIEAIEAKEREEPATVTEQAETPVQAYTLAQMNEEIRLRQQSDPRFAGEMR